MSSSRTSHFQEVAESTGISEHQFSELVRVNTLHKRVTGANLIDMQLMTMLARAKSSPEYAAELESSLPPLRPGVKEVICDVFGSKKITEVMEDGSERVVTGVNGVPVPV